MHCQRTGDSHTLLLTAGKLFWLCLNKRRHADFGQEEQGVLLCFLFGLFQNFHRTDHAVL